MSVYQHSNANICFFLKWYLSLNATSCILININKNDIHTTFIGQCKTCAVDIRKKNIYVPYSINQRYLSHCFLFIFVFSLLKCKAHGVVCSLFKGFIRSAILNTLTHRKVSRETLQGASILKSAPPPKDKQKSVVVLIERNVNEKLTEELCLFEYKLLLYLLSSSNEMLRAHKHSIRRLSRWLKLIETGLGSLAKKEKEKLLSIISGISGRSRRFRIQIGVFAKIGDESHHERGETPKS